LPIPTYYPILEIANYGENVSQLVGVATNAEEKARVIIMESHATNTEEKARVIIMESHATNDKYEDRCFDNGDTKTKNFQETLSEVEMETNEDDGTWSS
jgi:hypothetical protein